MRTHSILGAMIFMAGSSLAHAGQADVCYGPTGPATAMPKVTSRMVFECPSAGTKTIPDLARDGWRIAAIQPVTVTPVVVVSSGAPTMPEAAWMLIIEKP